MAIHGIGTDIVSIQRIRAAMEKHEGRFARKILSDTEWGVYAGLKDGAAYLAKRFAAKEAFFKALGEPSSAANTWHQLAVLNDGTGRPYLQSADALTTLLNHKGIVATHVTLSDEREHAVAFVLLEKDP